MKAAAKFLKSTIHTTKEYSKDAINLLTEKKCQNSVVLSITYSSQLFHLLTYLY